MITNLLAILTVSLATNTVTFDNAQHELGAGIRAPATKKWETTTITEDTEIGIWMPRTYNFKIVATNSVVLTNFTKEFIKTETWTPVTNIELRSTTNFHTTNWTKW